MLDSRHPAPVRIALLERPTIERDGIAGDERLRGRRAELVFAFLTVERRRAVTRDELATLLWPDALPDTWGAALRGVLSELRRFLSAGGLDAVDTLRTNGTGVRLHLPPGSVVDLEEARDALARAREAVAAGDPAAVGSARRAADLGARPFLADQESDWVEGVRRDLGELHSGALELLARAELAAGRPAAAADAAERLVRAEPLLEAAHRVLIETLSAAGDRTGAARAYERCRAMLSEAGSAPAPETEAALQAGEGVVPRTAPATPMVASVLVVEDHDFQRRTTLTLLRGLGISTLHEAADGQAALTVLETIPTPDVIVCDIDMPGMDGVEFIRKVAERHLASAVIIASGLDERLLATVRSASEGYGLQVLGAVQKPLTTGALTELFAAYRARAPETDSDAGRARELASALAAGTLKLDFEPIVDLTTGAITAVRALYRGTDAVAPAGHPKLARRLAEHVLAATRDAIDGLDLDGWVAVGLEALADADSVDALSAISRSRLVLTLNDPRAAAAGPGSLGVLARLRVRGFGLCLGGATAGEQALASLPLTHVWLPSHLLAAAATDAVGRRHLREIAEAARRHGLTTAGACADQAGFDQLLTLGCSLASGPFLAAPMPAGSLSAALENWNLPPMAPAEAP